MATDEITQLKAENARLRLERDMLALNPGKDSSVFVIYDRNTIVGVTWPESQSARETPVNLPDYAT